MAHRGVICFAFMFVAMLAVAMVLTTDRVACAAGGGQLVLEVVDRDTKKPLACRIHLRRRDKPKAQKVRGLPFWHDHFVFDGQVKLRLSRGDYLFELEHGLEYPVYSGHFTIEPFADDIKQVDMQRFVDMSKLGWWSGDIDVRRLARHMELLMMADDLHVVVVEAESNRKHAVEIKIPKDEQFKQFDKDRFYATGGVVHEWPGATVSYFNLTKPLSLPGPKDEFPSPLDVLNAVREQPNTWVDLTRSTWWDLPMLIAHGQIDSIRIANEQLCRDRVLRDPSKAKPRDKKLFPAPRGMADWTQEVYFRLLDCGLRIPPSAGSASGESPNPVGYNRMYVHTDGPLTWDKWFKAFKAGQVTITNGPLLQPNVHGYWPGHVFNVDRQGSTDFEIGLTLSTRKPISYLEIIRNGQVYRTVRLDEYAKTGQLPPVSFDTSGWFLVRAVTDMPGNYCFAMTGPYYVESAYQRRISREDVQFFLDWVIERGREIKKIEDPEARRILLAAHKKAFDFWQDLLSRANSP